MWGRGEVYTMFWWRKLRDRNHLEYPGVDRRIIFRWSSGSGMGSMDQIYLAQDKDRWRALVNVEMNLWVP